MPIVDYGDLPVVRWRPDRHQRRPHNLQAVLGVLGETTRGVEEILADGPLLRDDRLLLSGYTNYPGAKQDVLVRRNLPRHPVEQIGGRPREAAEEALARVSASAAEDGSTADVLARGVVGALAG